MNNIPPPPPPPPPVPAVDDDIGFDVSEAARQRSGRRTVSRYAKDYLEAAIIQLGALMNDPKAGSAQVKACENIIAWGAGKPGRYVNIAVDIGGKTIDEAVDAIVAATANGQCSIEDGQALLDMLKKKSDVVDIANLQKQVAELTNALAPRTING